MYICYLELFGASCCRVVFLHWPMLLLFCDSGQWLSFVLEQLALLALLLCGSNLHMPIKKKEKHLLDRLKLVEERSGVLISVL